MTNFITPEGQQVIRNFKYKGGSIAYSYNYIWSPFAQFLLKFIPISWAPNSITLAGFLINVIGCLSLIIQGKLGSKVQNWTLLFFSICVFTYQNLDNVDGKQARRTGNSTPLGMIFDHGCDAFGLIFLCLGVGRVIGLADEQLYMFVGFIGAMFGFYFSVWCQYHSKGIMILGNINAVDDGIPTVWMLGLFTYFMGQSFWSQTIIKTTALDITPRDFVVYGVLLSSILQIFSLLSLSKQNFTKNYAGALKDLIHIFMILAAIISIVQFSNMLQHHFYGVFFTLGMMFVRNIIYMQLCVTAQMKYNQFQMSTILFTLGYPIYIFALKDMGFPQALFIYGLLAIIVIQFFYFVINVIRQFARILNIHVFKVNKIKSK